MTCEDDLSRKVEHMRKASARMMDENSKQHKEIIQIIALLSRHVEDNSKFQQRVRWTIGVAFTILGIILMAIYQHLPWIWDALPKHGQTH